MTETHVAWAAETARFLTDASSCPRCGTRLAATGPCARCGADLSGPDARAVWDASVRAADLLLRRQKMIERLPLAGEPSTSPERGTAALTNGSPRPQPQPLIAPPAGAAPSGGEVRQAAGLSVQSLLAIAGAGLFASAAVVFTFLNPDLTDPVLRIALVGLIAAVFGVGAGLLRRVALLLSAEVVGALGVVLWGLDLGAIASLLAEDTGVRWWVPFGAGVAASSSVLIAAGVRLGLRSWLWVGAVGVTTSPALVLYATGSATPVSIGHLLSILAGVAVLAGLDRLGRTRDQTFAIDRGSVLVVQIAAAVAASAGALVVAVRLGAPDLLVSTALLVALSALGIIAARYAAPGWWGAVTGVASVLGFGALALGVFGTDTAWALASAPAGALVMFAVLSGVPWRAPLRAEVVRRYGATALVLIAAPALAISVGTALQPVLVWTGAAGVGASGDASGSSTTVAALLGALPVSAAALLFARSARRDTRPVDARAWTVGAVYAAELPLLGLIGWAAIPAPVGAAMGLASAVLLALSALTLRRRTLTGSVASAFGVGAHLSVVSAVATSWRDGAPLALLVGVPALLVVALVMRTAPSRARVVHTAAGFSYALVLVAAALSLTALEPIAVLCLTVCAAAITALGATLAVRVPVRHWYAVLGVTAVPFLVGVASAFVERSGWTGLSTALIFLLALTLLLSARPGLALWLRVAAAGLLVPSLAVIAVSIGAEALASSGSPVVLPAIAVLVAVVLGGLGSIEAGLARRVRQVPGRMLGPVVAIEVTTWLTGGLAALLALVRDAAGLPTTLLVLVLLGLGASLARILAGRRYGWWGAGALWTAALWTVWALLGVDIAEPYYLPTAGVAASVGAILVHRRRGGETLVVSGLAAAIVPTLVLLSVSGDLYEPAWRTIGLLLVGAGLLVLAARRLTAAHDGTPLSMDASAALANRPGGDRLGVAFASLGMIAALAGAARAVRWGVGFDAMPPEASLIVAVTSVSLLSVALLAVGGRLLVRAARSASAGRALQAAARMRLLLVPALLVAVTGPITAVRDDWPSIWTLWVLTLLLLTLLVVSAARSLSRSTSLPAPVLVLVVAWVTAVAGWSPRELRVEWFSLPLGVGVLLAGALAFGRTASRSSGGTDPAPVSLLAWPRDSRGSWALLGPGLVLTLLPSVLATGTDPQTWRAILVIAFALVAILAGSSRRLAAPFLVGLIVLPVENVVVFAVQIGRNIGALPWWITLATAGIVLLALAVGSERKTSRVGGVGARIRELR